MYRSRLRGADAESDAGSPAEEHATNGNGSSFREDRVHEHDGDSGQAEYGEAPLPDDPGPGPEEDSGGYEWQAATSMPEASDNRKEPGLVTAASMENGNNEGQEASSSRAEQGELSSTEKSVAVSNDNPDEEKLTGAIRFGLAAVKNVGTQAMESIMIVRQERPFDSLLDFCRRVDLRVCNKRVIESLIQAGAFDTLPGHRAQLLAMLDETVEAALKWRKEREDLQIQLFDFVETPNWEIEYPEIPPYSSGQQLELERELLGLYLSGHPLDDYEDVLESSGADRIMELTEAADDTMTVAAGMVVSVKSITTKQGKAMAFMELEDQIERCEVVLFPEVWRRSQQHVGKGELLVVRAKVQQQDEGFKLLAEEVVPLSPAALEQQLRSRDRRVKPGSGSSSRPAQAASPRRPAGAGAEAQRSSAGGDASAVRSSGSQGSAATRSDAGGKGAATAAASRPGGAAEAAGSPAQSREPRAAEQRVFVKIAPHAEKPELLARLKQLLQEHPGPVATVLFYEQQQKLLALSDAYRIKPSPTLFSEMEKMLGEGTVKIK
ncbi:DNA polymerase III alpha subunit [Paenibacillus sp. W2I17]|nr:DNA polymerase III alpha subunit [Paenibacillus sp. W2I17]